MSEPTTESEPIETDKVKFLKLCEDLAKEKGIQVYEIKVNDARTAYKTQQGKEISIGYAYEVLNKLKPKDTTKEKPTDKPQPSKPKITKAETAVKPEIDKEKPKPSPKLPVLPVEIPQSIVEKGIKAEIAGLSHLACFIKNQLGEPTAYQAVLIDQEIIDFQAELMKWTIDTYIMPKLPEYAPLLFLTLGQGSLVTAVIAAYQIKEAEKKPEKEEKPQAKTDDRAGVK